MISLRAKLLRASFLVVGVLAVTALSMFAVNVVITARYRTAADTMIAEHHLTETVSDLVAAYNNRFRNIQANEQAADKRIDDVKKNIADLTAYLDGRIKNPDSVNSYVGLKNIIANVTSEIDSGLAELRKGNVLNASGHYDRAVKQYAFAKENGTELIFNEVKYVATIEEQINNLNRILIIATAIILAVVVVGCAIYIVRFARTLVWPLDKLTKIAGAISNGDTHIMIDDDLLARNDEIGSLSASFKQMVARLKDKINELKKANDYVEQQVEERTQELNEEKIRLDASVDSLNVGLIMTDMNSSVIKVNQAALQILTKSAAAEADAIPVRAVREAQSLADIDAFFTEGFSLTSATAKAAKSGRAKHYKEVEYRGKVLRVFIAPIVEPDANARAAKRGFVILLDDITEDKVHERSREEFFSIASHELRTPLTAIRGGASMIEEYYPEVLKDQSLKEIVGDIHTSSVRLIEIVNDFLDSSRLEHGKVQFKNTAFALDDLIQEVVYEMMPSIQLKHIRLAFEPGHEQLPNVVADRDRTKQILYNLIGNAAKFTEQGGITLTAARDGKYVRVRVCDTGPGIAPQNQVLLFHKFQQAGSSLFTRDATRGTGLGLYISKMLAERMGGKIGLESSQIGEGSVFFMTLPLEKSRIE